MKRKTRSEHLEEVMEGLYALRRRCFSPSRAKEASGIPGSQWMVLGVLMRRGEMSVRELAKTLGITSSAATQLVDELVAKKYIARVESAKDRRALILSLTSFARKKLGAFKKAHLKRLLAVFAALTDAELAEYARLSKKIASEDHQTLR